MTEGRRQRPDGKSFGQLFDELNVKLNTYAGEVEKNWKASYDKVVKEVAKYKMLSSL